MKTTQKSWKTGSGRAMPIEEDDLLDEDIFVEEEDAEDDSLEEEEEVWEEAEEDSLDEEEEAEELEAEEESGEEAEEAPAPILKKPASDSSKWSFSRPASTVSSFAASQPLSKAVKKKRAPRGKKRNRPLLLCRLGLAAVVSLLGAWAIYGVSLETNLAFWKGVVGPNAVTAVQDFAGRLGDWWTVVASVHP